MPAGVTIDIKWTYEDLALQMHTYEVKEDPAIQLWQMGTAYTLAELPVAIQNSSSRFKVYSSGTKRFVLVMKNDTDETIHFFAAPHNVNPAALSLGFTFKCLCVNHVYEIPPHAYWYRVVELSLGPDVAIGKDMTVTHTLVRVKK